MLGRKKNNKQEDWLKAWNEAKATLDKERSKKLIQSAIDLLPDNLDECVCGWSGGKDTLGLEIVMKATGKEMRWCHGTIGKTWEYPSFYDFCQKHMPKQTVVYDFGLDDQFMIEHPKLVFPETNKEAVRWYEICNQRAFYGYGKDAQAKHIILGHRTIDGNYTRTTRNGKVFPIDHWSHEDLFCVLACNGVELPDIYFYPEGFYQGTHAWIMRVGGRKAMEEVYQIDKNVLMTHKAIPKIHDFLKKKGDIK